MPFALRGAKGEDCAFSRDGPRGGPGASVMADTVPEMHRNSLFAPCRGFFSGKKS